MVLRVLSLIINYELAMATSIKRKILRRLETLEVIEVLNHSPSADIHRDKPISYPTSIQPALAIDWSTWETNESTLVACLIKQYNQ